MAAKTTLAKRLKTSLEAHPDWPERRRAQALRVPLATLRPLLPAAPGAARAPAAPATPAGEGEESAGRSVADLIARYDLRTRLAAVLNGIPGQDYRDDEQVRAALKVGRERWRALAGRAEFDAHRVTLPDRRVVWCHPRTKAYLLDRMEGAT